MQNKWTASVTKTDEKPAELGKVPEKNNSKKIGLAMGIVGAVLVTAGAAPMLFGNSENLTGDLTNKQEAVDPLVALLSGGNTTAEVKTTPSTKSPQTSIKPVATVKPTIVKATPKPITTKTPKASDKIIKVTNSNTGTTDKKGEKFHNASALVNTSTGNITTTSGSKSANITKNNISVSNGDTSISVQKSTTIKPPRNIQTGLDSNLALGLLFLLASGAFIIRSRKTA
ncbi:TPA: hypothetical protein EYP45_04825 [Candidatus Peregrinibacteria bacterium]|nr:hypothetical protein [Candidatus Peregrinibacteria bacterium]HIQ57214.1 hypothetical protein [Candidatus Gracilibacteria bacterium]